MPLNKANITVPLQSVTNDSQAHVLISGTFPAITQVNVLAGQNVTSSILNTDAAPSTYPTTGNDSISVQVQDQVGNSFPIVVTYTGVSGSSFTGCVAQGAGTTLRGFAMPLMDAVVTLNRTGSGNHPWLNTLTSATSVDVAIQSSTDGGTTWHDEAAAGGIPGGTVLDKHGVAETVFGVRVGPINPASNAARMTCTVHGPSAVEVSGTATITSR